MELRIRTSDGSGRHDPSMTHWSITPSLGKHVSEIYRNLSEFWRQIAEQLFCDRFRVVFGANSTNSTVFVAIHTKSKILIGLELLISFINTVTAWRRFLIQRYFIEQCNRKNDRDRCKRPRDEGRWGIDSMSKWWWKW